MTTANELAVRRALESAGVEFTNGDQPGVRLTKAAAAHFGRQKAAQGKTRRRATEKKR